jgi:hypothetical protein
MVTRKQQKALTRKIWAIVIIGLLIMLVISMALAGLLQFALVGLFGKHLAYWPLVAFVFLVLYVAQWLKE